MSEKKYLIVESRGANQTSLRGLELALELAEAGFPVRLWLVQDAIQLVQLNSCALLDQCTAQKNITIYIDEFSVAQRGCDALLVSEKGLEICNIDVLSEHLMCLDCSPIWH